MTDIIREIILSVGADVIKGIAAVLFTAASSAAVWLFSYFRKKQRAIEAKLQTAMADIAFLLEVEKEHGRLHTERSGQSLINIARRNVRNHTKLNWSGKYTPSRMARRAKSLSQPVEHHLVEASR